MTASIPTLLARARQAIAAGEAQLKKAAEHIAQAKLQGATQDKMARALGRSPAWVSVLLRWRQDGFKGAPFGPQSRAARKALQARAQSFRRVKAEPVPEATTARHPQSRPCVAPQQPARDEQPLMMARAEAERSLVDLQRLKAQAMISAFGATISPSLRRQLIAALESLPATHPAERVRARLGMAWDELVVPAEADTTSKDIQAA